ncbi:MAG TPA: electron transfer flavoprotein subunit alpha/FixB family protein [Ignavibacteria bacterium]|nr:electron transfer flavoprotein subunit alpha/FixB family protein [Ignavibacteria bacterium]HRF67109.1 electron transfer flavoprotein subunit alpha/FixB family protein [Ignavibacteria bacterium]HRJ04455.1 electron transfer flavoprotein subunit alpha/FixB family protein [Ignavibacteria bacterium]HRJ85975.1 electron transfer flavoprotein subunit alpha/FixB family protein [Ignavibacteria bacterium]
MSKILAFVESRDNRIKNSGFETASTAVKLAAELGLEAEAILIGNAVANTAAELGAYGIKKVLIAEDPKLEKYSTTAYSKILAEAAKARGADIIILSATAMGKDLSPRVSAKLEAGLVADCTEIKTEGGNIIATRPVYAGKALIDVKVTSRVKIYSLRPNVFKPVAVDGVTAEIEQHNPGITDSDLNVKVKDVIVSDEKLDVTEANVVVSGGRGLKGPENFYLVEDLAKVLGGAAGASRAIVDAGWRPHSDQVGQTGKTVSPSLYIAVGISGAIQHLAGMSSSKCIVAINKDKDAPIFQIADYGIVADALEIMPALTEEFKKVLSN